MSILVVAEHDNAALIVVTSELTVLVPNPAIVPPHVPDTILSMIVSSFTNSRPLIPRLSI